MKRTNISMIKIRHTIDELGYDTCDGDSGNPLMRFTAFGWVAEGIVR